MVVKVSVVMPVYNCRTTLGRALDSVFAQTLDQRRIEVIAVDDGSTDGSGADLDRLARDHRNLRVLHQPNSGGPGGPRNAGLTMAKGEYVFFLDSDDWLGAEALERMCAMADEQQTDVVVGRYAGINRKVPEKVFRKTLPRATPQDVYETLAPLKLFRRSLIAGLRFKEGQATHEDQIFTSQAYLTAAGISVLADYDCYYWVEREDGTSALQQPLTPAATYFPVIAEVMTNVADHVAFGPDRDVLMERHFRQEVYPRLRARFLEIGPEEQDATWTAARDLVKAWLTPGVRALAHPFWRVNLHCLEQDRRDLYEENLRADIEQGPPPILVEDGRAYARHAHFRDPAAGIPDECYELTGRLWPAHRLTSLGWAASGELTVGGEAVLERIEEPQTAELVLRPRGRDDGEHRVPLTAGEARIDLAALPEGGHWDVYASVTVAGGVRAEARFGSVRDDGAEVPALRLADGIGVVRPYLTEPGNLSVELGGQIPSGMLPVDGAVWAGHARLRLSGRVEVPGAVKMRGELRIRDGDRTFPVPVSLGADGGFTADLDLAGAGLGRWDLWAEITVGGAAGWVRLPAPVTMPPAGSAGGLLRAVPYITDWGTFTVLVSEHRALRALRRLQRRT
jgi:glycosyltransferase involved in cell wall biosynthesis